MAKAVHPVFGLALALAVVSTGACRSQPSGEPEAAGTARPAAAEPARAPEPDPAPSARSAPGREALPIARQDREAAPGDDRLKGPGPGATRTDGKPARGFSGVGQVLNAPGPGEGRTRIEGCLSAPQSGEAAATKFPAAAQTRGAPGPAVKVRPAGRGVTVVHDLDHACCLTAEVDTKVAGTTVEIVEKLSGSPCRCLCHSTLSTAIGLAPGDYELVVILQQLGGSRTEVHREKVSVGIRRK